jgi:hypothetical protein
LADDVLSTDEVILPHVWSDKVKANRASPVAVRVLLQRYVIVRRIHADPRLRETFEKLERLVCELVVQRHLLEVGYLTSSSRDKSR